MNLAKSTVILEEAKKATDLLKKEMFEFCTTYPCDFRKLILKNWYYIGVDHHSSVNFIFYDPPYIIRMDSGQNNSYHNKCEKFDMKYLSKHARELLAPEVHGHLFFSVIKFPMCNSMLYSRNNYGHDGNV